MGLGCDVFARHFFRKTRSWVVAQQSSGISIIKRWIPSRAEFPSTIPLVLSGTTCGQPHRNRNPKSFFVGPRATAGAIMLSVQRLSREMSGRLLSIMESKRSQIQPRFGSEISCAASIGSLPFNNTLTSCCESLKGYAGTVALNEAHPFQLVQIFGRVGLALVTGNLEIGLERTHDAFNSNCRLACFYG